MADKPRHCAKCALKERPTVTETAVSEGDIMFIGGYPVESDTAKGPFMSRNGAILRGIIQRIQAGRPMNNQLRPYFTYACMCAPEFRDGKMAISAEIVEHCAVLCRMRIDRVRPKVIVAMGGDALRAVGLKGRPRDLRGGIYHFKLSDGTEVPVVATFHVVEVAKSPGLVQTFHKDILKACQLVDDAMTQYELDIRTPRTAADIAAELDALLADVREEVRQYGKKVAIAVDTETTSLSPYHMDERVTAISLSHRDGVGIAYPFQHRDNPFTDEEFAVVRAKTEEVLSCPNVSIVMANGKFDMQWLSNHYGLKMNRMAYDVHLAEHILDEDKKGVYSLKNMTCDRFPSMGKYEAELKEHLQSVWNAKDEKVAEIREAHKEKEKAAIVEWWCGLDDERRQEILSGWVGEKFVELADVEGLREVKRRKYKGEMVVPKKYQAAVARMVSNVPWHRLPDDVKLPAPEIPEELLRKDYEDADIGILLRYAAIDALTTRMICKSQQVDFAADNNRIRNVEKTLGEKLPTRRCDEVMRDNSIPLCHCLADMEFNGVRFDREKAERYREVITGKIDEARDAMYQAVGFKFNPSASSPDLGRILYEEMKLPVLRHTDSGAPSTDADTIRELMDKHESPLLKSLLAYRKLDKCLGTYINNWIGMSEYDGRIHTQFIQIGTATYRLSSASPNLQNIPFQLKEASLNLKELFLPDSDEYELYDLDISNAEMRVLTGYSKDQNLIYAFNSGKDLHCLTAAGISNYTYEDILANKEDKTTNQYLQRQVAKRVNFGVVYCMSSQTLKERLWEDMRTEISEEQAQEYMDKFFETYPGVKQYIEETKNFVTKWGFAWTYTGRRRRFAIASFSQWQASRVARQAVNARIQTTSSDLVMYNLIDLSRWLKEHGGRVILTVHDSILFQLPKGATGVKAELDRIILENTAERAPWMPVRWKYDVGRGPSYGDTHGSVE